MRWWLGLAVCAGCGFEHGTTVGDGGTDGGKDASHCRKVDELSVTVCLAAQPSGTLVISSNTHIDTDGVGNGMLQCRALESGSTDVCVLAAQSITIDEGVILSASGSKPLVLVADALDISGTVDIASHRGGQRGPAANASGCNPGADPTAGGGGQGGSFGTVGGVGGDQDPLPNTRGLAGQSLVSKTLRGGCAGASGGGSPDTGGAGGGALLAFATSIAIRGTGVINASGEAGVGGQAGDHGGGGGGSGGMIALAAPTITLMSGGQIFANGAGGGAGTGATVGESGTESVAATVAAQGGAAVGTAGDGGAGFPQAVVAARAGFANGAGGGGGGGGGGVIRVLGTTLANASNVSPPPF